MPFDRAKVIAVMTGIISLLLGVVYLVLVQILDLRGEMVPAPLSLLRILSVHLPIGYS
jgi:hypothetical protein